MTMLPPVPDVAALVATRASWHTLAEHVVAAAEHRVNGRIGLRATPGGFGTPPFGDGEQLRVDDNRLLVTRHGTTVETPITTIAAAAAAAGIEPGAPADVYAPTTPLAPDAPLTIDPGAADVLAAWFELGASLLLELRASASPDDAPSDVQLWPEHFDLGVELGSADRHERATFGASSGDDAHPLPYLYVTRWPDVPDGPFWSDPAFPGASVGYDALASTADAATAGRAFFAEARRVLTPSSG